MANWQYFVLVRIEFLGFRYHGWQKQAKLKSVQGMIDKTLLFILKHENFKTLGCGRTDAKVSADDFAFELFLKAAPIDDLLQLLNEHLPCDIRAKSITHTNKEFNIIQHAKEKEYHYYFSFGEKSHPFNAPTIRDFGRDLDLVLMQKATRLFVGTHNFRRYASKPSSNTVFVREILSSYLEKNTRFTEKTTPKNSYVFKVKSKGFLRYQVRLMMGALIDIGRHDWSLKELKESLEESKLPLIKHIAPSSGLILHRTEFE